MNEDRITVTGVVGSDPRPYLSGKGLPITTFRLASSPRVFDRERGEWRDGETNWYTVSAFRRLADNVAWSLRKGEHVVVTGKLRLRAWQTTEKSGTSAEIDADAIGHDLSWAVTRAQRLQPRETTDASAAASAPGAASGEGAGGLPSEPEPEPGHEGGADDGLGFGFDERAGEPLGFDDADADLLLALDAAPGQPDSDVDVPSDAAGAAAIPSEEREPGDAEAGEPAPSGRFSFGRR
jgi:single-strand DNA-binding protein